MTSPIKVGILGLSANYSWAANAHVQYLTSSDQYNIVALCNSSVKSAEEAIAAHKLPAGTKAYGNPEELAKDPNVDLVVCSTRVDRHYATIAPALKAGKNVYVEWPLGKDLKEAEELLRLSEKGLVKKAIVGLQGRTSPVIREVKDLITKDRIGKVLSSTLTSQGGNLGETESAGISYLATKDVGGNLVTIHFGHTVDYIQDVLGEFKSVSTLLANRRPTISILAADGTMAEKSFHKTSDDTIFVQGTTTKDAIPVSITMRGGKPFKNTPGLDWRIYGEKGEIRITCMLPMLQYGFPDMKIEVHDFEKNDVEEVPFEEEFAHFPLPARNVARVYKAFAEGDESVLCSLAEAVERHRFIDEMYKSSQE